ncbi:MAG: toll/interleukin-1 receptor domain-containing protein [Rhizomicrobium sp.]
MADDAVGDGDRYWAFISYSHRDAAFGRRLHRRLENYAIPRRLVGRPTARGIVPARLSPIFRDREEFPAAGDLSLEVRAALRASRSLIVVCSRSAVESPWVSREIETFRELHPDRPILAAIVKGEPFESFPAALRSSGPGGVEIEPLAADFREKGDGARAALLKLVAGIAGIGLDELVQRDAQRNIRRVTAVTVGALAGMLAMGLVTIFAFNARAEAERQRKEAEGLVGFMLTDLRDKLVEVGRLDVMNAVYERAQEHYNGEGDRLPPDAQSHYARLLQAFGEDDEAAGAREKADREFADAYRITANLLKASPTDVEAIYGQAQSDYWVGFGDYSDGKLDAAKLQFAAYLALAKKLVAMKPGDPRFLRELAFAEGNLCSIALRPPVDAARAIGLCEQALLHMQRAAKQKGASSVIAADIVNRESWMATAFRGTHDNAQASLHLHIEEDLLNRLLASDPFDMTLRRDWIADQRLLARVEAEEGDFASAQSRLQAASKLIEDMARFDPQNRTWASLKSKVEKELHDLNSRKAEDNDRHTTH